LEIFGERKPWLSWLVVRKWFGVINDMVLRMMRLLLVECFSILSKCINPVTCPLGRSWTCMGGMRIPEIVKSSCDLASVESVVCCGRCSILHRVAPYQLQARQHLTASRIYDRNLIQAFIEIHCHVPWQSRKLLLAAR
jgi:hypothetical protein